MRRRREASSLGLIVALSSALGCGAMPVAQDAGPDGGGSSGVPYGRLAYGTGCIPDPATGRPGCPGDGTGAMGTLGSSSLRGECLLVAGGPAAGPVFVRLETPAGAGATIRIDAVSGSSITQGCATFFFVGGTSGAAPFGSDCRGTLAVTNAGANPDVRLRVACDRVPENSTPARVRYVSGAATGSDPQWGVFDVMSCSVVPASAIPACP